MGKENSSDKNISNLKYQLSLFEDVGADFGVVAKGWRIYK